MHVPEKLTTTKGTKTMFTRKKELLAGISLFLIAGMGAAQAETVTLRALMEDVPEKYYLSQKQMEQLLYKSMLANREKESTQKKD